MIYAVKKRDDYMNYEGNVHVSSRFFNTYKQPHLS